MEVNLGTMVERVPAMLYQYAVNHDTGESSFPFVSDFCEEMFGFPAETVINDPKMLVNCILEDEAEQYAAAVMESMENLTPFDRLGRMRRADGRIINVHYKSRPRLVEQWDEQEGTTSTYTVWDGIVFDVTKQVTNEASSRTKLQDMIDRSLQPVFEIDTLGVVTEWNKKMVDITGFDKDAVLGKSVVDFMPQEELGSFDSFLSSTSSKEGEGTPQEGDHLHCDCVFLAKDKKYVYLNAKCSNSRDANGSVKGRIFCCQDVTMFKDLEKQKDAALELVDAERGLSEWLSHEVRNPLSVALEAAMALKEGDDDAVSCIDLICESIHYIVDLLTNLLDLNKCLEGKIELHPSKCRIREEILLPTLKMMALRQRKVDLRLSDGAETVCVVDKLRLRQVVTNLISNALKFTAEGFVCVESYEHVVAPNKRTMRITVSDSGCGIKESDYDMLFSKWEQLGSKANGTGIGLCLCKALVKAMRGQISLNRNYFSGVEGRPGAQFVIDIPVPALSKSGELCSRLPAFESLSAAVMASQTVRRQDSDLIPQDSKSADLVVANFQEENGGRKLQNQADVFIRGCFRILVVDDDLVGRKLLKRRLTKLFPEAEISQVSSGEAALLAAAKIRFDIITIDHFMAVNEMSGEETIRALRTGDVDALIVGISGNLKEKEHLSAGAEDFFQKPLPSDEVLVSRLMKKLSPPGDWSVLCVDDADVNIRFLCRRLRKVAAPHFTSLDEAEKRWKIWSCSTGEEAMQLLKKEWFDLVIVDQHLQEGGATGSVVASFVREHSRNKDALVVLNSGSLGREPDSGVPFNLYWPKPLPSTEKMRHDLCHQLLETRIRHVSR